MNLNDFAVEVSEAEGKKISVSIAQIKEIVKIVLRLLKEMSLDELTELLKRVR